MSRIWSGIIFRKVSCGGRQNTYLLVLKMTVEDRHRAVIDYHIWSNLSITSYLRTAENVHYIRVFTTSGCSLHQGVHYIRVFTTSGCSLCQGVHYIRVLNNIHILPPPLPLGLLEWWEMAVGLPFLGWEFLKKLASICVKFALVESIIC